MESLALTTCSVSTSMASPRWHSARLAFRASARDQREMPSRAQGASCVAASALQQHYATVPLPPLFKGPAARQSQASTAHASEAFAACWSVQSNLRSLIHTRCSMFSLEAFIRDPVAWLMNLVYRLQSTLARLFTGSAQPAHSGTGFSASAAASSSQAKSAAAATYGSATRRCSSGRYVPSASGRQANDAAQTPTRLVATQQVSPAPSGQRMPFPVAALAVAAAGALAFSGVWLFRRWRAMVEVQRELVQRAAVKKDNLARQKQRFQRALVVDSVNLELPPIKDMDVQPGPVRVEKIISQTSSQQQRDMAATSAPQRGGAVPGLAGESLRQWQQFMAASRAKEVTNVSGSQRGSHGATEQPGDRPYSMALDDRMLADLSERIRRANDLTAAGEAPPPMPVITFEQLYANNQESDDEAMARRAAERKARWQKEHPEASAGAVAPPRSTATARPSPVPPKKKPATATASASKTATASASKTATASANKATTAPASKPRSKAPISDNPFAVGIIATSTANSAPSSALPAQSPSTSRSHSMRGGPQPQESSTSRALPARQEAAATVSSPAGGVSSRKPFLEPPVTASFTTAHTDTPQPSGRGGSTDSPPANRTSWRTSGDHGVIGAERRVEAASAALPSEAASASTPVPTGPALASPSALPEEESPSPPTPTEEQLVSTATPFGPAPSCSTAVESFSGRALEATSQISWSLDSCREETMPSTSQEADGPTLRREHDELLASPGRVKRQPAIGQLRTPETQAPALKRLMRRPSGGSPAMDEPKLVQGAAPELQLSESAP